MTDIKMATQESSNTTLEMGTSDQALVDSKRKKRLTYIIGGTVMLIVIAVTVTLVVLLSGNEGGEVSLPIGGITTEGPTSVIYTTPEPTTPATTPASTVTEPTTTTEPPTTVLPPSPNIELEAFINGVYAPANFNATWTSGSEAIFRNADFDVILYDVDTDSSVLLLQNRSELLRASSTVQLSPDGTNVVLGHYFIQIYRYSAIGRYTAIDILTDEAVDILPPNIPAEEALLQNFLWGPSGTACAFVYLNNIYYKANLTADPIQVTTNGVLGGVYNGIPDWVYEEEVLESANAIWFSSTGEKLAYATFDDTNVQVMRVPRYGIPGALESQYTVHNAIRYPKTGTNNPLVSVTLRDLLSGASNTYTAPTNLEQPILKAVSFVTSNSIALMWTNRVQTDVIVQLCLEGENTCSEIFTYSEVDGWMGTMPLIFNEAGNAFITILPQAVNGERYSQIVQVTNTGADSWTTVNRVNAAHTVGDILKWTTDNTIWYKATGLTDTADQHIYSIDANNNLNCFTCNIARQDGQTCEYNDATLNEDASRISVSCLGPGVPQIFIYNTSGVLVRNWEESTALSTLITQQTVPHQIRLQVPVAAGFPAAEVLLQVPQDYESRTNVPLLVEVYGGPATSYVTKQWSIEWGASLVSRWGIAVAHIDGRGSDRQGVSNMFALNRQLGTFEIEDQINVTRYLQENLPWLDANRTCIWGWSYGGYAASLALARGGDVFRCAIAVAPVADWRYYDSIYTERYMDIPANNTQGYQQSSLLTEQVVEAFRGKRYFLVHGTADDNVHYQHAMLLSRLLQRRDVLFDQMTYTDEAHSLNGVRPHLFHALEQFLTKNML